jgi:hypothetical protein
MLISLETKEFRFSTRGKLSVEAVMGLFLKAWPSYLHDSVDANTFCHRFV